jgi:hypothetical protein
MGRRSIFIQTRPFIETGVFMHDGCVCIGLRHFLVDGQVISKNHAIKDMAAEAGEW